MDYLAAISLMLTGLFLMLLVLIQRGRGGGLAGAFGGLGGQSAFGTKAGDVFTKITVIVAVIWVSLASASILAFTANSGSNYGGGDKPPVATLGSGAEGGDAEEGEDESGAQNGSEEKDSGGNDSSSSGSSEDSEEPE